MKYFSYKNGFTLIELLVVISIIGILSALLMSNFIGVRQRARDAQRKSDLRQIQSALELYRSDVGSYPASTATSTTGDTLTTQNCPTPGSLAYNGTVYMQKIPCDPNGTSYYHGGNYSYYSNGTTYSMSACLENTSDTSGSTLNVSSCPTKWGYVLTNP